MTIAATGPRRRSGPTPQAMVAAITSDAFDRLARLARRALGVPAAALGILDDGDLVVRGDAGLPAALREGRVHVHHSLCARVVERGESQTIRDARSDARFAALPEVKGGIVAHAAAPLVTRYGEVLGIVCAIDFAPREWTPDDVQALEDLAGSAVTELEMVATARAAEAAERQLRESEERYRLLVEASQDAIAISAGGTIRYVNDAGARLLGARSADDVVGRGLLDLVRGADREGLEALVARFSAGQSGPMTIVRRLVRQDGDAVDVEATIVPFVYEGMQAAQIVARDVTEREELEEQRRQSQKLEAIGRLAGGIAHDFNNLLTVITSYTQLLLRNMARPDARQDVEEIADAADRAARLTKQLLTFGRRQATRPAVLDLNNIVRGVESLLARLIGERVRLELDTSPEPLPVRADAGQMEQVLMNLAVNARDAMPGGGTLTIESAAIDIPDGARGYAARHVGVAVPPGSYAVVTVTDSGVGMDAATKAHLFEPFFTTKEPGQGTGLGLAIVYGIVKQAGGYVWVYSTVGAGTTFKIYLPASSDTAMDVPVAEPDPSLPRGTETLLVVEDDDRVRAIAVRILKAQGYDVLEAGDGASAIALADAHGGPIHLLLSDVVMPGMHSRELAATLRARDPGLRLLFITGYADRPGLNLGGPVLEKPFSPGALATRVRDILDGKL